MSRACRRHPRGNTRYRRHLPGRRRSGRRAHCNAAGEVAPLRRTALDPRARDLCFASALWRLCLALSRQSVQRLQDDLSRSVRQLVFLAKHVPTRCAPDADGTLYGVAGTTWTGRNWRRGCADHRSACHGSLRGSNNRRRPRADIDDNDGCRVWRRWHLDRDCRGASLLSRRQRNHQQSFAHLHRHRRDEPTGHGTDTRPRSGGSAVELGHRRAKRARQYSGMDVHWGFAFGIVACILLHPDAAHRFRFFLPDRRRQHACGQNGRTRGGSAHHHGMFYRRRRRRTCRNGRGRGRRRSS